MRPVVVGPELIWNIKLKPKLQAKVPDSRQQFMFQYF
jgi:hypothetical protein